MYMYIKSGFSILHLFTIHLSGKHAISKTLHLHMSSSPQMMQYICTWHFPLVLSLRDERMLNIKIFDRTGLEPEHYYYWKGRGKEYDGMIHVRKRERVMVVGEREREEREERELRAGNPNEYLISAYLTPGKVQSDGMAGLLPRGVKGRELGVPCTSQQLR